MWSIFIVIIITGFVVWVLTPTIFHMGWYMTKGRPGYDRAPALITYFAGGSFERLNTPEFGGLNVGEMGDASDYDEALLFLAVYNYISNLIQQAQAACTSTSTSTPDAANNKQQPQNSMRGIIGGVQNTSDSKWENFLPELEKCMYIWQVPADESEVIMAKLKRVVDGCPPGMPLVLVKRMANKMVDATNTIGGPLSQSSVLDPTFTDPVAEALLLLTENGSYRICRSPDEIQTWRTSQVNVAVICYFSIFALLIYLMVECWVDPASIFFGAWII